MRRVPQWAMYSLHIHGPMLRALKPVSGMVLLARIASSALPDVEGIETSSAVGWIAVAVVRCTARC